MLLGQVLVSLLVFGLLYEVHCYYNIPEPQIEVFVPKGFRISVEDIQGISQVQFRVNITRTIPNIKLGTFQKRINHKKAGRWIFTRRNVRLKIGDIISYEIFVVKDDMGYKLINELIVADLVTFHTWQETTEKPSTSKPTTVATPVPSTESSTIPSDTMMEMCKEITMNATQTVMQLESQIKKLLKENDQLIQALNNSTEAKKLTLAGRIPPDDDALGTVKFILWEKLDLKPTITSAKRNPDKSITFELATLPEKFQVLENAKEKLKHTRIIIH